jgi:hypothetical protein
VSVEDLSFEARRNLVPRFLPWPTSCAFEVIGACTFANEVSLARIVRENMIPDPDPSTSVESSMH